ncbi:MAG: hypothetical protein O3A29_18085 [Planctomycetota bacterium]|nr:hypothetical protein [Planctomycetota bacterium]
MGQMGLLLNLRLETDSYWCTPINSLSFGRTGGDGAHFSFLVTGDTIDAQTPVIITVPDNHGDPVDANIVLGRSFEDFIRLGLHCGYFSMAYINSKEGLKHYARTDWEDSDAWFPSDNHRVVAEYVAQELNLKRLIYSLDEFLELRAQIKPLIRCKVDA